MGAPFLVRMWESLDNVNFSKVIYPFLAAFIDQNTGYEKTVLMTRMHTRCNKTSTDVAGDLGQQVCGKEELGSLKRKVKGFKRILVKTFEERYDTGSCTLKYHLLFHMEKIIPSF